MNNSSMLASNIYHQQIQGIPIMEARLLINNKMYHTYLPNMTFGLSLIYIIYLIIIAIQKHFKRKRTRMRNREKAYLRKKWEQQIAISLPDLPYPQQTHRTPSSSVTCVQKTIVSTLYEQKNGSNSSSFLNINPQKKLDLLWQWSVSMGYCHYEYGRNLDNLVKELQEKQNNNCIVKKN